jgi:ERO1-like protein alpha
VERVNLNEVKPLVGDLVKTPFFRYFKVDLYCECPLWPDDGMCSLRDCSVCECEEHEIPEPWRKAEAVEACDSEPRR